MAASATLKNAAKKIGFPFLLASVSALHGVGEAGAALIARLVRRTPDPLEPGGPAEALPRIGDLLFHLPVDLIVRQLSPDVASVVTPGRATLIVRVADHTGGGYRGGKRQPYRILCLDDRGDDLHLIFFRAHHEQMNRQFPVGSRLIVSGRAERYHGLLQIAHPDIVRPEAELAQVLDPEPVYPLTADLSQGRLEKWIATALSGIGVLPEWLDPETLRQQNWPAFVEGLERLHHPQSRDDLSPDHPARLRLAYDEALASQLALRLVRRFEGRKEGPRLSFHGDLVTRHRAALPFKLTEGQRQVLREIAQDFTSGQVMLRLLQGDVGSGKTIVAFLAMLSAIDGGHQAAIMAPTSILAGQHYRQFAIWGRQIGFRVALLSGALKSAEREALLRDIADGSVQMVVGTHALFQRDVQFKNLGIAVIDEQHRFGVMQRMALAAKAEATHLLLMTATPIPRSLTLTLYGDLDSSLLKEKPAGRQAITTRAVPLAREAEILLRLESALAEGARIYWICPLVGDAESPSESDFQAAILRHAELAARFPGMAALVHGRMKTDERDAAMLAFARGEKRILVATTVIEVGIDVPEATIIVIENAERFGLSQLHQLRGRVGRGDKPSSCVLLYGEPLGAIAKERLQALRDHDDGFVIAEEDLRLRGGGDLLGTRQSGLPEFRFVDLAQHAELIAMARQEAHYVLERDPHFKTPRGKALVGLMHLFGYHRTVDLVRSG